MPPPGWPGSCSHERRTGRRLARAMKRAVMRRLWLLEVIVAAAFVVAGGVFATVWAVRAPASVTEARAVGAFRSAMTIESSRVGPVIRASSAEPAREP